MDRTGAQVASLRLPSDVCTACTVRTAVLSNGRAALLRDHGDADPANDVNVLSVDTAAGKVRWQRNYQHEAVATLAELPPSGTFERRLLARSVDHGYTVLHADTGEALQTWSDDTARTSHHLAGWYGSVDAAYLIEEAGEPPS